MHILSAKATQYAVPPANLSHQNCPHLPTISRKPPIGIDSKHAKASHD